MQMPDACEGCGSVLMPCDCHESDPHPAEFQDAEGEDLVFRLRRSIELVQQRKANQQDVPEVA